MNSITGQHIEMPFFSSISEFMLLDRKLIGRGSFGAVKLAIHLPTSHMYAIKVVRREDINTQIGRLAFNRQSTIHPLVNHPHIVKMWQVLEDEENIYMVLEYVEGGNLFYYQNQKKVFSEEQASVFFCQTLSAIEYLHSADLIHRDLKPENLLLDKDLNLKVCDFGWIAKGVREKRTTFCGTYEYMAPEMIFDKHYDYRVDIWALGILLYELLHGYAPFEGDSANEVRSEILNGKLRLDPSLSPNAQDLIFQILKIDPEQRISLKEIKKHAWIKEMMIRKVDFMKNSVSQKTEKQQKKESKEKESKVKKTPRRKSHKNSRQRKETEGDQTIHQYYSSLLNKGTSKRSNSKIKPHANEILYPKKTHKGGQKQNHNLSKSEKELICLLGHRSQFSDFSDLKKKSRLKTELSENKNFSSKKQVFRMKTEAGGDYIDFGPSLCQRLKKRKTPTPKSHKNRTVISTQPFIIRNSFQ